MNSYVYIKDKECRYTYANKHTLELFKVSRDELFLSTDDKYFPENVAKRIREIDLIVLSGQKTEEEIVVGKGHEKRVYHEVKTPIYSDKNTDEVIALLGISTDITCQKGLEEEALRLSRTDELTKIANRYVLNDVCEEEFLRFKRFKHPFSIIIFDLDFFKIINDKYGHLMGDKYLVMISQVVSKNIRAIDTLGRWGGDEFLLVFPETNLEDAISIAEKLRKMIELIVLEDCVPITASFGVSTISDQDTIDSLKTRADKALYAAKRSGKNKVVGNECF